MKIRQSIFLGFFLFFIISTYCGLIPNNRVNLCFDSIDSTNDFNLVEGITYKIVHLKSGFNLCSNGSKVIVTASDDSNPNQRWSLRKAGVSRYTYNIVSVGSGTNLDNNGGVLSLQQNSLFEPKQYWIFTKAKNHAYNIAVNETSNLDSDDQDVYIRPSDKNNSYQQWLFEPSNYNLTLVVTEFAYPPDLEDNLDNYKTRVSLLNGKSIIDNPTNAIIEQTIDKTEIKSNRYILEISKVETLKNSNLEEYESIITIFLKLVNYFVYLKTGYNLGFDKFDKHETTAGYSSDSKKTYKKTISREVSYHIQQKVTVPAFTSVAVDAIVDKINLAINFTVKILVTGKADRLNENGKVVSMINVDANALRCYLQKKDYDIESENAEENSEENFLIISKNATLKVDGYGLNTTIESIPLSKNWKSQNVSRPESSESPKNPVILYQIVFTLLQIITLQQIFNMLSMI